MKINSGKLQNVMLKKAVGYSELSKKSGVARSTIYRCMNSIGGDQSIRVIGLISNALGVDSSEIAD